MNRVISFIGSTLGLGALAVGLIACGNREDLSRAEARKIIEAMEVSSQYEKDPVTPTFIVYMRKGGFEAGAAEGLWTQQGDLTEKGQRVLTRVTKVRMFLREPVQRSIEVTGITTPVSGFAVVTFKWRYEGLQPSISKFAVSEGSGEATLELFDDGWRPERPLDTKRDRPVELSYE